MNIGKLLDSINPAELIALSPKYLLIMDLEATCCDEGTVPNTESEIIEIGAVIVQMDNKQTVDAFTQFIKPSRHPALTSFCTKLTTITQTDVDKSPSFEGAMAILKDWLQPYQNDYVMCSWGNYDKNHIISDCKYFGVTNPLNGSHINLKTAFAKKQGVKRCGLRIALEKVGLGFQGQHHRGIDDTRNIVKLLDFCI